MADDFGDYGVEVIKPKSQVKKEEKPVVAPVVQEEVKDEFKVTTVQQTKKPEPVKQEEPPKKEEPEELDEEEMYSQCVEVNQEKRSLISEEAFKPKFFLENTFVAFLGNELLVRECSKTNGWYLSDILGGPRIAEYCSIATIDPNLHKTDSIHAIASGGLQSGYAASPVYGMIFESVTENTVEQVVCKITQFMPFLKQGRFMHQSCIVKSATGFWQLMAIGGKFDTGSWTQSVQSLNLIPWFRPGTQTKDEKGISKLLQTDWEDCAPMTVARSNFACVAMKTMVYVFGGIMGKGTPGSEEEHHPKLAPPIERYMPMKNAWEVINIAQAPRLAAFAWCTLDEGKICVLGGTDGFLLNSDMYILDFKEEKVMVQHTDFEFSTGGGHMYYSSGNGNEKFLNHVGGFNSDGINFWLPMGEKEWKESNRCHTHVLDTAAPELTEFTSSFFK